MEFILRITVSHYKAYACNLNCMKIYVVGLLSFFFFNCIVHHENWKKQVE